MSGTSLNTHHDPLWLVLHYPHLTDKDLTDEVQGSPLFKVKS